VREIRVGRVLVIMLGRVRCMIGNWVVNTDSCWASGGEGRRAKGEGEGVGVNNKAWVLRMLWDREAADEGDGAAVTEGGRIDQDPLCCCTILILFTPVRIQHLMICSQQM
jgi:hypothetical protein